LLGREVAGRAENGAGEGHGVQSGRAGDPEVGDVEVVVRVEEQVCRLDVAVHDPVPVRRVQRRRGLLEPGQRASGRLSAFPA